MSRFRLRKHDKNKSLIHFCDECSCVSTPVTRSRARLEDVRVKALAGSLVGRL